ncbi:MAG: fatty acid desaturase [Isosphaeraceae bacterium]|nr:fatty acid desaturase [Isosphaeraceae bacterium]
MTTSTATSPATKNQIAWPAAIWIMGLHAGALLALNFHWFTWQALLACLFLHWLTGGIGICMTYHRLLTHRSFATRPKWLEYVLTAIGACASEGGAVGWVADHRRHHAHSDEEEDTHSPNRGFGWAHMFWWMTPDITSIHTPEYYEKWAPDLNKDPVHVWLDKYHYVFPILLGVGLYFLGRLPMFGGNGMAMLVWGCFVRSVLVLHTTWLVNSATHMWGYRSHETRDNSTNLWWVALLTYGEGWHNNHHAYQTSARHGMAWWEVDMTYLAIRLMSFVGLAYAIKVPKVRKTGPPPAEPSPAPSPLAPSGSAIVKRLTGDDEHDLVPAVN